MMIHAAGESSPGNLDPGTYAIALTAPDEMSLEFLQRKLERAGLRVTPIYEPDEPYNGALMALGIKPGRKEALKRHLSSLPLLR